jgi:hypothetical protein
MIIATHELLPGDWTVFGDHMWLVVCVSDTGKSDPIWVLWMTTKHAEDEVKLHEIPYYRREAKLTITRWRNL